MRIFADELYKAKKLFEKKYPGYSIALTTSDEPLFSEHLKQIVNFKMC